MAGPLSPPSEPTRPEETEGPSERAVVEPSSGNGNGPDGGPSSNGANVDVAHREAPWSSARGRNRGRALAK